MSAQKTLPPDIDGFNNQRAKDAQLTLHVHYRITASDWDSIVQNLLIDLMHYCDRTGEAFGEHLVKAVQDYRRETGKE